MKKLIFITLMMLSFQMKSTSADIGVGGYYTDTISISPMIIYENNNIWRTTPKMSYYQGVLRDISCTETDCYAVGDYKEPNESALILFSSKPFNTWVKSDIGLPSSHTSINSIHCDNKDCHAGGFIRAIDSYSLPLIVGNLDKKGWFEEEILNLPQQIIEGYIYNITCIPGNCFALGKYSDKKYTELPLLLTNQDNNLKWTFNNKFTEMFTPSFYFDLENFKCNSNTCVIAGSQHTLSFSSSSPMILVTHDKANYCSGTINNVIDKRIQF